MPPLPFHGLCIALDVGGIVQDQETCHDGWAWTTRSSRALGMGLAGSGQVFDRPGSTFQEAAEAAKGDPDSDLAQQAGEGAPLVAVEQLQQYGDEVLPLRQAEDGAQGLSEVAQAGLLGYKRLGHGILLKEWMG